MDGVIKVDNFECLKNIRGLKNISTTEIRLLSHDYSPVLQLKELEYLSINMPGYDCKVWNDKLAEKILDIAVNRHCPYMFEGK